MYFMLKNNPLMLKIRIIYYYNFLKVVFDTGTEIVVLGDSRSINYFFILHFGNEKPLD